MHKGCLQNVFAFSKHWLPVPCYYFFLFNNYHKYTTNSAYCFNREESREFYKMKRGHENLYKIKGGHEQKNLESRDVNYIPNFVSCNPRLFAVDTCLLVSSPSLTVLKNECNKEINKLQVWFSANELQINPEKSAIIVIPSKLTALTTNLSMFYNERPIKCFESSKYLGVNLDYKLNFKSHICIIENKVARSVGICFLLFCFNYSYIVGFLQLGM